MRLTFRYRLYPTRVQDAALHAQVDEACRLYNAARVPKRLSDREHACVACGLIGARDHVSAQLILQRAGNPPLGRNVEGLASCVS